VITELRLLYRDEELVVVDKPSGLLVHRGWGDDRVVAMTLLRDQLGMRVYPVHRLDRATSGALLFALSPSTAAALGRQLEQGEVNKKYLALARGAVLEAEGVIDHPIPKSEGGPRVAAVTRYRRLWTSEQPLPQLGRKVSLVEAEPVTGRLHQIRRHLKHLGHPLVGDVNYGRGELNRYFREQHGLRRLALHARRLTLRHPGTGALLSVAAPIPEDLSTVFSSLGISLMEG